MLDGINAYNIIHKVFVFLANYRQFLKAVLDNSPKPAKPAKPTWGAKEWPNGATGTTKENRRLTKHRLTSQKLHVRNN